MAKDKSHQMDFRGLELIADEFTLSAGGSPGSSVSWDNVTNKPSIDAVSTADAADSGDWTNDGAAVVALVNALKAKVNEIAGEF